MCFISIETAAAAATQEKDKDELTGEAITIDLDDSFLVRATNAVPVRYVKREVW